MTQYKLQPDMSFIVDLMWYSITYLLQPHICFIETLVWFSIRHLTTSYKFLLILLLHRLYCTNSMTHYKSCSG